MYFFNQISDNGVVSFNNTFSLYTPRSLPLNGTNKIIAPYWADVDITGTGNIYYRQTTDSSLLARATSEIRAAFSMSQNFMAKHLLIVTWNAVGYYYRNTDKVKVTCVPRYVYPKMMMHIDHSITYYFLILLHIIMFCACIVMLSI